MYLFFIWRMNFDDFDFDALLFWAQMALASPVAISGPKKS
jgi:hypothetical protein